MDKAQWFVWNCPPRPRPLSFITVGPITEFFTKVGLKKQNVTFAFCFFRKIWLKGVESWKQFVITHHDLRYRNLNLGKKWKPPLNLNVFLLKFPRYLSCIKDIFTIVESWKTKNVTWSFFLLLKLALLSQKMKIQNHTILVHNERFVVPKNLPILYQTVNSRAIVFLRKTMDPVGTL